MANFNVFASFAYLSAVYVHFSLSWEVTFLELSSPMSCVSIVSFSVMIYVCGLFIIWSLYRGYLFIYLFIHTHAYMYTHIYIYM